MLEEFGKDCLEEEGGKDWTFGLRGLLDMEAGGKHASNLTPCMYLVATTRTMHSPRNSFQCPTALRPVRAQ